MASCAERAGLVALLAIALPGCVTGHLLDAARRRERPVAITGAALDGDGVVLRYDAEVTDDAGVPIGARTAAVAVPLETFRTATALAAEAVPWRRVAAGRSPAGRSVPLIRGPDAPGTRPDGPALHVQAEDGRDTALVWRDAPGAAPGGAVPTAAFTRIDTAPWVWPLLPGGLAIDVVVTPILVFFAPAVMVVGE